MYCHNNWAARDLGGISIPLLSDFHLKGAVASLYGVYLEEAGITDRATVIVDNGEPGCSIITLTTEVINGLGSTVSFEYVSGLDVIYGNARFDADRDGALSPGDLPDPAREIVIWSGTDGVAGVIDWDIISVSTGTFADVNGDFRILVPFAATGSQDRSPVEEKGGV